MRIATNSPGFRAMLALGVGAVLSIALCGLSHEARAQTGALEQKISAMESDVIADAKQTIDQLGRAGETTTLEDLNRARQAISRIDAMIELERRLNELEKLRRDRRGGSSSSVILASKPPSMLPSDALSVSLPIIKPVAMPQVSEPVETPQPVVRTIDARPDILRISGAGGRYTALLKFPNGDIRAVKVGDKLSDAETVRDITASSVKIRDQKGGYTLQIKNVDVVFSAAR